MNVFSSITLRSLRKSRTRTTVTVIGVILSAAMITGILTFTSSLQHFFIDSSKEISGDWYGQASSLGSEKINKIRENDTIADCSTYENIGYAELSECDNKYKPYIYVAGADDDFFKTFDLKLQEGRLPRTEQEIAIPEHLIDNGGVRYAVGDEITLNIGKRFFQGEEVFRSEGLIAEETEDGSVYALEEIVPEQTRTYTVTGIINRLPMEVEAYQDPGYMAVTKQTEIDSNAQYHCFFKTTEAREIYDFVEKTLYDEEVSYNDDVLMYMGVSANINQNTLVISICLFMILLIIICSVSLIYNAFSISVSEKTKQFGLLSSVGATRKQLRKSIYFEALIMSLIGVPAGVICGVAGTAGILYTVRGLLVSMQYTDTALSIWVTPEAVAVAFVVSFVMVMISAYIPAKKASGLSAIDAIKLTQDIKVKKDIIKSPKWIYKIFGLEGTLADKNFKRNKKQYRATVLSLFISIVLFISVSSFCTYLAGSLSSDSYESENYDISYTTSEENSEAIYEALKTVSGVKKSVFFAAGGFNHVILKENITKEDFAIFDHYGVTFEDQIVLPALVCVLDNESFSAYRNKLGLSEKEYRDEENPKVIASRKIGFYDSEIGDFRQINIYKGRKISSVILERGENNYRINIGTFTQKLPMGITSEGGLIFIASQEAARGIFGNSTVINRNHDMFFKVDNPAKVFEQMKETCRTLEISKSNLFNMAAERERDHNLLLAMNIISYAFIALISLIAMANVFNTISTNVLLRRREFAMLTAVGMEPKSFNKMLSYECLMYGIKALAFGLPVSIGITYLIYTIMAKGQSAGFILPWKSIIISIVSVFAVVFATMLYAREKIKNENIMETLKKESF